jgi:hypothetical protein
VTYPLRPALIMSVLLAFLAWDVHATGTPESQEESGAEAVSTPATTPEATEEARERCPTVRGKINVYAIGSSTMGDLLGPMLKGELKRLHGVTSRKWGKASTGLARPDFHDWPKEVPRLNRRFDPEVYVISLGTNDAQPLKTKKGWIRMDNPRWETVYAERVDRMLNLLAGPEQRRMVIWLGPTAFRAKNSKALGPRINRILKTRIAAFKGNVHFIDLYAATSPRAGRYIKTVRPSGAKKSQPAWGRDGVHLSRHGVRALMLEPVLDLVAPCLTAQATSAKRAD